MKYINQSPHPKVHLNHYKSNIAGKFPHHYRVFNFSGHNMELFEHLATDGFFKFHTTNNLNTVSEHQIIAFYYCGGIYAYRNGFTCQQHEHEIHHIDGNGLNNHPSNLVYLTCSMHQEITGHQRVISGVYRVFGVNQKNRKLVAAKLAKEKIWGKNGKDTNLVDKLISVLSDTLIKTSRFHNMLVCRFSLGKWVTNVARKLKLGTSSLIVNIDFLYTLN